MKTVNESLDTDLKKTQVPEDSMLHVMGAMSAAMVGGDNFKMHKLDGAGYMIQYDKDGATELHHVDDDLRGGYLKKSETPSMKMISTYRKHIKGLVDSGKKVRIVSHDHLADQFKRLSDRVAARNPGYNVSGITHGEHEITGDKTQSWEISK